MNLNKKAILALLTIALLAGCVERFLGHGNAPRLQSAGQSARRNSSR